MTAFGDPRRLPTTTTYTLNTASDVAIEQPVTVPRGQDWWIERIAITQAIGGGFGVYSPDSSVAQNLIDGYFDGNSLAAWSPQGDGIYLPGLSTFVLRFFGQPNNQACTVNLRVRY